MLDRIKFEFSKNQNRIPMKYIFLHLIWISTSISLKAQHNHLPAKKTEFEHTMLFQKAFSDPGYTGKEVMVAQLLVPARAKDTIAHHHDCQLIGYIAEGEVITKMKDKDPIHLTKGQVFYEYPNEIHESLINPNKKKKALIILYYLYNTGANLYKPEGK